MVAKWQSGSYDRLVERQKNAFKQMICGTESKNSLNSKLIPGGGALSTCTYGEVSPIFLGQNVAKSDIFGSIENFNYVHDIFLYQTSFN